MFNDQSLCISHPIISFTEYIVDLPSFVFFLGLNCLFKFRFTYIVSPKEMHPSYINSNCNTSFDYNNSNYVAAGGVYCFNSPVTLENNCLKDKGSSKKDRHSKINTARGPRDRRMRLSLDVAKKFFNLQDMLGYDKASNTIEWLLVKSRPAIRDLHHQQVNKSCSLMGVLNSPSSGSECEVVSGLDDQVMEKTVEGKAVVKDKGKLNSCSSNKEKKRVERVRKSVCVDQSLAKETREKARARARKRTTEKINIKYSKLRPCLDQEMDQNTNRFGSWIPFVENQVQLTDQAGYPSSHSSLMSSNWGPSLFNYQHNNRGLSHEHQLISDLQILGKPWEGINN